MRFFAACLALCALPGITAAQTPKKAPANAKGVSAPGKAAKAMHDGQTAFSAGDFSNARKQWGKLKEQDPGFKEAQGNRALTLYGLKRDKEFLKQVDTLDAMTTMTLAPAMKEELGWKYIEASHRLNDFEAVVAHEEAFEAKYPDSPKRAELREYKMNALYKRGIKAAQEAALAADPAKSQARKDAARLQLLEFENMALADATPGDYAFVKNQKLADQLAEARLTLGGEEAALADSATLGTADREKFDYLKIQVHQRLHADKIDDEITMLQDYITGHPKARQVNRAYIDLQSALFKRGEQAFEGADELAKAGKTDKADARRADAHKDFEQMRILMEGAAIDPSVGVTSSEILDIHKDWLYSYWLEKNYQEMYDLSQRLVKTFPEGSLVWAESKIYEGMAYLHFRPYDRNKAIAAFDAALRIGLKNKKENDQIYSTATVWRMLAARQTGDMAKVRDLEEMMKNGGGDKGVVADFFKNGKSESANGSN